MSADANPTTGSNAPSFDPLRASPEEEADMAAGYRDGWAKRPPTRESIAYAWGRGSAARDRGDEPDAERRAVERRMGEVMRRGK